MPIPKLCGIETEYGLVATPASAYTQAELSLLLMECCPLEPRVNWNTINETPGNDARYGSNIVNLPDEAIAYVEALSNKDTGDHAGYMLGNGARLYSDHSHPEYCTPECVTPLDVLRHDAAGQRLLNICKKAAEKSLPQGHLIHLFKNNSDGKGNSYGCHENYLMQATAYQNLFDETTGIMNTQLIPFLVSRIIITGSGKVGSENGRPNVDFQISQRADFFEELVGIQTMQDRPLVNTRDEAHADRSEFRRLHVISGDANMAELSTYLKVGTMQLLLMMIEDDAAMPRLPLRDPLKAIAVISHDTTCTVGVPLINGQMITAIEIQSQFARAATQYVSSKPEAKAFEPVVEKWQNSLQCLSEDPILLKESLDWVIKRSFLEEYIESNGLTWNDARVRELDIRYHDIDPEKGAYGVLVSRGLVKRLLDDSQIEEASKEPPSDTRACARAHIIRTATRPVAASWGEVIYEHPDGSLGQQLFLNPLESSNLVGESYGRTTGTA